jgi:hypothetical protein
MPGDPRPRGASLRWRAPCPPARSHVSLGCEQRVRLRVPPLYRTSCQTPARERGANGAARGAGARWRRGCVAHPVARRVPGPRAGVRLTLGFRPPNLQEQHSTARRPDPRTTRAQGSAHCCLAARRRVEGFPSVQLSRARRRRAPGVLAHWLGVAAARRLLCSPISHTRVRVALRTATAALRGTTGPGAPSVAARQVRGAKASNQARSPQRRVSTHVKPTQEGIQGGEERRWLRCSRWGDGGVVAGSVERRTKAR